MAKKKVLPVRAFQLHISHYDPRWVKAKGREKPIDLDLAAEIIDAMAEADMTHIAFDIADGVKLKSAPDLERKYTIPMRSFKKLVTRAHKQGLGVIPKLNFARSGTHQHNQWFRPYCGRWDGPQYWDKAFELIDELIEVCDAEFFHIGMDEDHKRSHRQFSEAVKSLEKGLKKRKVKTVMWKDDPDWPDQEHHREKSRASEDIIPKRVIQVPWGYGRTHDEVCKRLSKKGFTVWGAPGWDAEKVRNWRDLLLDIGGKGLYLTRWIPCRPGNRKELLRVVKECGPVCHSG